MAFNQFMGTSFSLGSTKGPKGDKGDQGVDGPPYLGNHITLQDDHVEFKMNLLPFADMKADIGTPDRRFHSIYAKDLIIGTETIHIQDPGSEDSVSISYSTKGDNAGSSNVAVKPAGGGDFSVKSLTTSKNNPDKLDPELIDFTGLRFRGTIDTSDPSILETMYDTYDDLYPTKPLEPGDYFIFTADGNISYAGFPSEQNVISVGDLVVFTNLSPSKRWAKVPFRIPHFGVSTVHLEERAVSTSKVASNAITSSKITNKAVTSAKLEDHIDVRGNLTALHVHAPNLEVRKNVYTESEDVEYEHASALKFGPTEHGAWRIVTNPTPVPVIRVQVYDGVSEVWVTKFELDGMEEQTFT